METPPLIAIVEDDEFQRDVLTTFLDGEGFRVAAFAGGGGLRELLARAVPDVVLLDVRMPGEDGFTLAAHVRRQDPKVGIIFVSAAGATLDRVTGLEIGADDYIAKPFELRELLARVRSVLRRVRAATEIAAAGGRVRMGRCIFDLERRALLDGNGANLTEALAPGEFDLLRVLAAHPHRPLERDWLAEVTRAREADPDRPIDARIARLRRKIEHDPLAPRAIRTVRGVGYMFVPEET